MRKLFWLFFLSLLILPWLSSEAELRCDAQTGEPPTAWRRTTQGWEQLNLYGPEIEYRRPALHPAVFGSLEILLTVSAMLAFADKNRGKPQRLAPMG